MAKPRTQKESLYLQVVILDNGQACFGKFVKEATETSVIVTTTNTAGTKTMRNYELFDEIEGIITTAGVWDKESDAGAKWEMTSISVKNSEGTIENVQCNFKSRFSTSLITRLEGIDVKKPITLKVFRIKDKVKSEEKKKDVYSELLLPYQMDTSGKLVSIKTKYGFIADANDATINANPNKLPEFKVSYVTKNKIKTAVYDSSDYEESLRDIAKAFDAHCRASNKIEAVVENTTAETSDEVAHEVDKSGLPF